MEPDVLILLSGGIDSTACVNFYMDLGVEVCGLFINYGQKSAQHEARSARAVAKYYSIDLLECVWRGPRKKLSGFINGRNSFLISAALMECPNLASIVAIGIHKGTNYEDCSIKFLNSMQDTINIYSGEKIKLSAPFIDFTKNEILSYCVNKKVPIELTYSCENGSKKPCGLCLSCKDKEILNDLS